MFSFLKSKDSQEFDRFADTFRKDMHSTFSTLFSANEKDPAKMGFHTGKMFEKIWEKHIEKSIIGTKYSTVEDVISDYDIDTDENAAVVIQAKRFMRSTIDVLKLIAQVSQTLEQQSTSFKKESLKTFIITMNELKDKLSKACYAQQSYIYMAMRNDPWQNANTELEAIFKVYTDSLEKLQYGVDSDRINSKKEVIKEKTMLGHSPLESPLEQKSIGGALINFALQSTFFSSTKKEKLVSAEEEKDQSIYVQDKKNLEKHVEANKEKRDQLRFKYGLPKKETSTTPTPTPPEKNQKRWW